MPKSKNAERVDMLLRVSPDMKAWLDAEKESTGRSLTYLCNHAIELWRDRIEKGRAKNANAADST